MTQAEKARVTECAKIWDDWDMHGCWTETSTGAVHHSSPSIGGYNRPRGDGNAFVALDGTQYELDASGRRVAPGYWNGG